MDPRHPELAIARMRELMEQYDRIEGDIKRATISAKLAQLEREGGLVVQEICLVAPRIHEAMMQTSRQRRHDLARGVLIEPQDTLVEKPVEEPVVKEDLAAGKPAQAETVFVEPKPKKKTTRKKTTKKAEK